MIPSRDQIFSFIEGENCELMGHGCWQFHEICQDIADYYQVTRDEFWEDEWFVTEDIIWDCYSELKEIQRVEYLHRKNGWGQGASAA